MEPTMPNVHLTGLMADYVETQVASGAYANASEVIRAGLRLLMQQDGARAFYELKADLLAAVRQVEEGKVVEFDPVAYEPDAYR
jgi:antitoxin ParD1/3/4